MASRVESGAAGTRVILEGTLGVGDAPTVAEHLKDALAVGQPVLLDLGELSGLDASIVQLILSARASGERSSVAVSLGFYGYALERLLGRMGLARLLEDPWFQSAEKVQFFLFGEEAA